LLDRFFALVLTTQASFEKIANRRTIRKVVNFASITPKGTSTQLHDQESRLSDEPTPPLPT
jgi:hypothetical protein